MPVAAIPELCSVKPDPAQLDAWVAQMRDVGYVVIPGALPPAATKHFHDRLATAPYSFGNETHSTVRLFERGYDFVKLLQNEPVFSLAERLFGSNMHIIALQGHRMTTGKTIDQFHSDELYLERSPEHGDEVEYPAIINVINCHYYLMDVPAELGPTWVVPRSHRACRHPRPADGNPPSWRGSKAVQLLVKAGDCVIYSNQLWHAGSPNRTNHARLSVVPSYSHRWVAQRFWPFLNYNLSRDILDQCTPRERVLLGEHPHGAYG
ncbi:MAG: phytanoyl-CoA dioxygenase family protein [Planctomycetota bacterium]|nr:phytanoyl-CoA dioxygenase family protein [Planctomycetota bacterium]